MDRRRFLAGMTAVLAGTLQPHMATATPEPGATPTPELVATRHGTFRQGTVKGVLVRCDLAVYDTVDDAEAASKREPELDLDRQSDISVTGPESVDMPYGLEDLEGSAWHAHTFEGAAAAETVHDWVIVRVDRAVWTFEVMIPPDVDVLEREARDAVVPAIEAIVLRAPDPTPASLTREDLGALLPSDDDVGEPVEWVKGD